MSRARVYITGAGIVSALGCGVEATLAALRNNQSGLQPLQLFSLLTGDPLPVGEAEGWAAGSEMPRTHQLTLEAARQALADSSQPVDAVVLGTTTGGILTTEQLLREGADDSSLYRQHGLTTVAEELAAQIQCTGPVLTVSTACSSGAAAISLALALLRSGQARTVLAGGADSLCRLTYFGFHSLQLVDPEGARPLDVHRQGMSVGEGAAMLLLSTEKPAAPLAEIAGWGLSCDAYHPATPRPDGLGAVKAMRAALADAGLEPAAIDYISLHGTGTLDNDRAESRAVKTLFVDPPLFSSIKGATGHSLAAAGAIEAVVAALLVSRGLLPANTGCKEPDPELVKPLLSPENTKVSAVLSNSFGFGGNNGSLVVTKVDSFPAGESCGIKKSLVIKGKACVTGSGDLSAAMAALLAGKSVVGMQERSKLAAELPTRTVRRLKRLAVMALSLARAAHADSGSEGKPEAVFMGTGWGALSETCDFLTRLTETEEQFPSPTDFIGSVHNGPAGQVAMMFQATGANITTSGGDYSFEQALLAADLLIGDEPCCVLGADEGHEFLSPLLDTSIVPGAPLADGGGSFCLQRSFDSDGLTLQTVFYRSSTADDVLPSLVDVLGGTDIIRRKYDLILVGIPAAVQEQAEVQLREFQQLAAASVPVVDYRRYIGQFASASAVAAVLAAEMMDRKTIPALFAGTNRDIPCPGSILVLGLGKYITAMECCRL